MLGHELHQRIHSDEFRPYTIVLANGERIDVKHRDSVGLSSIEVRGRRFFSSSVQVLEVLDNELVERVISMAMIAQVVDRYPADGGNGKH